MVSSLRIVWIYIETCAVWFLEPGRLADKDRGLWTLRREFESRPGYQIFILFHSRTCVKKHAILDHKEYGTVFH